jgi:hypothetical protein
MPQFIAAFFLRIQFFFSGFMFYRLFNRLSDKPENYPLGLSINFATHCTVWITAKFPIGLSNALWCSKRKVFLLIINFSFFCMTEDGELSSPTSSEGEVFPEKFWLLFKVINTLEVSMISTQSILFQSLVIVFQSLNLACSQSYRHILFLRNQPLHNHVANIIIGSTLF